MVVRWTAALPRASLSGKEEEEEGAEPTLSNDETTKPHPTQGVPYPGGAHPRTGQTQTTQAQEGQASGRDFAETDGKLGAQQQQGTLRVLHLLPLHHDARLLLSGARPEGEDPRFQHCWEAAGGSTGGANILALTWQLSTLNMILPIKKVEDKP